MPLKKKSKLKTVIDVALSFFVALLFFVSVLCLLLDFTALNGDFMKFAIERSGFQQLNLKEFTDDLHYISEPIGIEPALLADAIDNNEVKDNIIESVDSAFDDQSFTPDSTAFTGRVYNIITQYAAENELVINEENFQYVSGICGDIFVEHSTVSYVSSFGHYAVKMKMPLLAVGIACLVVGLLLCLQLWKMHFRKYVTYKFMIFGISASGLGLLAFPLYISCSGIISKFSIDVESLYYLFTTYCNYLIQVLIFSGLFVIVIALIMVVFYRTHKKAFMGRMSR